MRATRGLYRLHRWTGILSGAFILFFSITGAIAVYRSEIDRAMTPGLAIRSASAPSATLQQSLDAARATAPERAAELLWLPTRPDEAIVVRLAPGVDQFRVFVDPATAAVVGTATGEHLANVIRQTHLRFYFFGWQGRVVTGFFGLTMVLSVLTGLVIYAPFMKGVWQSGRRWWQLRDRRPQLTWSDAHKLIGITALAFNAIIGVSGAVLGLENLQRFSPALATALHPSPRGVNPDACATPLPLDDLVAAARRHMSDLTPTLISFPTARQRYLTVSGDLPGRLRAAGANWVTIDPCSGRALEAFDARTASVTASAYLWMEPLHFGDWGGWPLKLAYCLLGVTSGALSLSGLGIAAMKWSTGRRR